jgi:hypothetical protein
VCVCAFCVCVCVCVCVITAKALLCACVCVCVTANAGVWHDVALWNSPLALHLTVVGDDVINHLDRDFTTLLLTHTTRVVDEAGAGEVDEYLWKYRGIVWWVYGGKKYHYLAVHRAAMQRIARPKVAWMYRHHKYSNIKGKIDSNSPNDLVQEFGVGRAKPAIKKVAHMLTPALLRRIGVRDGPLHAIQAAFDAALSRRDRTTGHSPEKFLPDIKRMMRQLNRVNLQVSVPGRRFKAFPDGKRSHVEEIDLPALRRNMKTNQRLWSRVLEAEEGLDEALTVPY